MSVVRELVHRRDPFGVEPFYYARVPDGVVASASLETVLAHPDVRAEELDEQSVADYLITGVCGDAGATIYANVRRLPPGHELTVRGGEVTIRRYSHLPAPRRDRNAPARFEAALREAIRDRLTASSAVAFMSGGLDSTSLAALAREVAPHVDLLGHTSVYRTLVADDEESYAVEAARSIGIPLRIYPLDGYAPLQALDDGVWTADPGALLTAPMTRDIHQLTVQHAPVALHGHPADAVLHAELTPYLRSLGVFERLAALVRYTLVKGRPPYFFFRDLAGRPRRDEPLELLPRWLLARPHHRFEGHPLESPIWSSYFEWAHPRTTGIALEVVYPWLDERVVEAALAMPPVPWLVDKHVLRTLLRGRVSDRVRLRRKTFLQGDPWRVPLPAAYSLEIEAASRYIDPAGFRAAVRGASALSNMTLRAVAFEYWLRELPGRVAALQGAKRA